MNLPQMPRITNQTLRRVNQVSTYVAAAGLVASMFIWKSPGVGFDISMVATLVGACGLMASGSVMKSRQIRAREQQAAADRQELEQLRAYKARNEAEGSTADLEA